MCVCVCVCACVCRRFVKGEANSTIERCRRQRIEMCSADQSTQSTDFFIFQLSGWALCGTFVLCTASSRCMSSTTSSKIDGAE